MRAFALSTLPTLIFLAILSLSITVWFRYPPVPPVHLNLDGYSPYVVCPGEKIHVRVRVDVRKPSILRFATSIVSDDEYNIASMQRESDVHLFPKKTSYHDYFSQTAPNSGAGTYRYVIAAIAENKPERPSFLVIPFEIGEDCDARN